MSRDALAADLRRRAQSCRELAAECDDRGLNATYWQGAAKSYDHAAELVEFTPAEDWDVAAKHERRLDALTKRWSEGSRKLQAELAAECDRLASLTRAVEMVATACDDNVGRGIAKPEVIARELRAAIDAAKGDA